jgi:hypothetical protein
VRHAVCEHLGDKLDDQKKISLLCDKTIDELSRRALISRRASELVLLALLDSESGMLRKFGCSLIETDTGPTLSDAFFESLQVLANWKDGQVPSELLTEYESSNVRVQSALAGHPSADIRRRLARWNIDDGVRRQLENDSEDDVRLAAAEGREFFGIRLGLEPTSES